MISAITVGSCYMEMKCFSLLFKSTESVCEVEALMEKMKQLQECRDEEEASQEEMATRFEREKRESMFVCSSGRTDVACVYIFVQTFPNHLKKYSLPPKGKTSVIRCLKNITISLKGVKIRGDLFSSRNT